jgi:hypothetical protein
MGEVVLMWSSRDISLIITFSAFTLVFGVLIGRVPDLITGIAGIGYVFTIVYSISQSVLWSLFEGRRWRILVKVLLVRLISLLLFTSGSLSYVIPPTLATLLNSAIIDIFFNSFYNYFKRKNKLLWWIILAQLYYWSTHTLWILVFTSILYFPFESVIQYWFIPVALVMLPIMIIEAIIGGSIGYKIYRRVERLLNKS